jgi:hypothetical protein
VTGELWTAGKNDVEDTKKQFQWRSNKAFDKLKLNLFWRGKNVVQNTSCVFIQIDEALAKTKFDLSLGFDHCGSEKSFICEVSQLIPRTKKFISWFI